MKKTKTRVRHGGRTWIIDENGRMISGSVKNLERPAQSIKVKKVPASFKRRFGAQDNGDT